MPSTRWRSQRLARVLLGRDADGPDPSPAEVWAVAAGMERALGALDRGLDDLGEQVGRAVFELLRSLRSGTTDPSAARFTARVLLLHVGARVDVSTVEPLVEFLGAVAELPDDEGLFDATPDPDLPIEVALAAAVADPGARGPLRRAIFEGTLYLPVLEVGVEGEQLALQFVPIVARGCPLVAAFTSRDRLGDLPHLAVDGHELAALCPPGHGVMLNPGALLGGVLDEIEVRCLPAAPAVGIRDGQVDLRPLGPDDDDLRTVLDELGAAVVAVARHVDDGGGAGVVVLAVDVESAADDATPEQVIRRLGVTLAERGIVGSLLVPATSPLGAAVVAAMRGPR